MPDVKIEPELTSQQKARQARLKTVADNSRSAPIKVFAANEDVRRLMKHPSGTRFRTDMNAAVEWPHDSFTIRRIRDGSVVVGGAAKELRAEKTEGKNAREVAYARRPKEMPQLQPVSATQQPAAKPNTAPPPPKS